MRRPRRILALLAVQQLLVELSVALTILVNVIQYIKANSRPNAQLLLAKPTPITEDCLDPRWKWFKGCLGALDGTFIDVRVPLHEKGRYRTRKGQVAVNVLGVCNPNMQFIYVLSGWEGSAADSRVLRDAIHRDGGLRVPSEEYDITYANGIVELAAPEIRELFNLKHSSARNVIERTFGLLKVRWGILRSQSFYPIDVQNKIIIACCILHNFIRNEMPDDPLEREIPDVPVSVVETDVECVSTIESNPFWSAWRDDLASSMYAEWLSRI
ncbi:hypothetical protein Sango_1527800 [Sesamum angolense]|uniref:DDE Tnp4 domain-containing protein n=1 Tax=Sesamum angolense TaxID=2727404 RepID=A0AAE1WPL0_9LAMI|nr:hypothetical protein Sango_1527800 [Sesamum angolense]